MIQSCRLKHFRRHRPHSNIPVTHVLPNLPATMRWNATKNLPIEQQISNFGTMQLFRRHRRKFASKKIKLFLCFTVTCAATNICWNITWRWVYEIGEPADVRSNLIKNFQKHLNDHHTEAEKNAISETGIIKCKACEAIFYNARAYDTHNIHHKADDLYVVSEEQRFILYVIWVWFTIHWFVSIFVSLKNNRQKIVTRVDQDFDIRRVPFIKPETIRASTILCGTVGNLGMSSSAQSQSRAKNVNVHSECIGEWR